MALAAARQQLERRHPTEAAAPALFASRLESLAFPEINSVSGDAAAAAAASVDGPAG